MQALLDVVLPVFFVVGLGYLAVWSGLFAESQNDALMTFTQNVAIPCLLFDAISRLDLAVNFSPALMASFYVGAAFGFFAGTIGARFLFSRPWEDSVAIGFVGMFSNSVLLGLAITGRAYGDEARAANYAIIAVHAPFCYGLGMTVMEIVRNRGGHPVQAARRVIGAMFRNALLVAIVLGLMVNVLSIPLPGVLADGIALIARAALPAALFSFGGVLVRYRPEGDLRIVIFIFAVSLILHPAATWMLGKTLGLSDEAFRSAVLTAAMAPGVGSYIFANMYGVGKRIAATSVLFATAASVVTVWLWLAALP